MPESVLRFASLSNVSFELADVTKTLPFADGTFDIVHARTLAAVLPRLAWKPFVTECRRVLHESGVLLLTETSDGGVTNSPAFERMQALTSLMMWRAGYGFSIDVRKLDVSFMLPPLLRSAGYSDIQHAAYALEFSRETSVWADFYHNAEIGYMLRLSNYVKFADLSAEEIEHVYSRMLVEMRQDDFFGMFHFMTIVGMKP